MYICIRMWQPCYIRSKVNFTLRASSCMCSEHTKWTGCYYNLMWLTSSSPNCMVVYLEIFTRIFCKRMKYFAHESLVVLVFVICSSSVHASHIYKCNIIRTFHFFICKCRLTCHHESMQYFTSLVPRPPPF